MRFRLDKTAPRLSLSSPRCLRFLQLRIDGGYFGCPRNSLFNSRTEAGVDFLAEVNAMKTYIECYYKPTTATRPTGHLDNEKHIEVEDGEFLLIPNVGDTVSYKSGHGIVDRRVLSRHFSYVYSSSGNHVVVTIVVGGRIRRRDGGAAQRLSHAKHRQGHRLPPQEQRSLVLRFLYQ